MFKDIMNANSVEEIKAVIRKYTTKEEYLKVGYTVNEDGTLNIIGYTTGMRMAI